MTPEELLLNRAKQNRIVALMMAISKHAEDREYDISYGAKDTLKMLDKQLLDLKAREYLLRKNLNVK